MSSAEKSNFSKNFIGVRHWTRHSLVLTIAGIAYIGIGVVYANAKDHGPSWVALIVAREWFTLDQWAVVWCIVGVLAVISSIWPPVVDRWGYILLAALAAGWGTFYMLGVALYDTPFGNGAIGLIWWLVAFLWWVISGLVSPQEIRKQIERQNGRG